MTQAATYFRASIYRSDKTPTTLILPCPVTECRISRVADIKDHKIPLGRKLKSYGLSNDSRIITVSGVTDINANSGSHVVAQLEQTAYASMETLDAYLDQYNIQPLGGFEFGYFYKNTATTYYRKFKDVVCLNFDFDLGDDARNNGWFPYSMTMVARDPVIYTTAPGA